LTEQKALAVETQAWLDHGDVGRQPSVATTAAAAICT